MGPSGRPALVVHPCRHGTRRAAPPAANPPVPPPVYPGNRARGACALLIPLRTDAPVYHRPVATALLIAANVLAWIGTATGAIDSARWALDWDGFNPLQWVTSNFLHAGFLHLAANMLFLWVFGLIVEGKIGTLRFLAVYLGIGVATCAVEQLLLWGGSSLGASTIVFGLIGMGLMWAPENEIDFVYCFFPFIGTFSMRVSTTAWCFGLWEVAWAVIHAAGGLGVGSAFLHLMGVAAGVPLGALMLRRGWVDCEGWDWFSVRRGDHRQSGRRRNLRQTSECVRREMAAAARREASRGGLREAVASGNALEASAAFEALEEAGSEPDLADLRALA